MIERPKVVGIVDLVGASVDAARRLLANDAVRNELARLKHPLTWRHEMGESQLDWVEYQFDHGGVTGQRNAVRVVRRVAKLVGAIE